MYCLNGQNYTYYNQLNITKYLHEKKASDDDGILCDLCVLRSTEVLEAPCGITDEFPTYLIDDDPTMPIITLEVLSEDALVLLNEDGTFQKADSIIPENTANVVLDNQNSNDDVQIIENGSSDGETKIRTELLEYVTRKDGSVICKLCGEILQSRTHWYRHKYKVHVITPLNPTPLFQCEQCLLYFKSRKGYIGHLASSHSEMLADASPVLCNSQIQEKTCQNDKTPQIEPYVIIREIKERRDITITKTNGQQSNDQHNNDHQINDQYSNGHISNSHQSVVHSNDQQSSVYQSNINYSNGHHSTHNINYENSPPPANNCVTIKTIERSPPNDKKYCRIAPKPISALRNQVETIIGDPTKTPAPNRAELQAVRSREEKLVTDIIERVRRECEMQGVSGPAPRRGYARRSTTMI